MRTKISILCLLVTLVLCSVKAYAQDLNKYVVEGKRWVYYSANDKVYSHGIGEEVEHNGKIYHRLYVDGYPSSLIRQEGGKVYLLQETKEQGEFEFLIYDFDLKVGDSIRIVPDVIHFVDSIKTQNFNGVDLKVFFFKSNCEQHNIYGHYGPVWYEGMGVTTGFLDFYQGMTTRTPDVLLEHSYKGKVIYKLDNFPHASGVENVKDDEAIESKSIYSVNGVKLSSMPKRGIYIKNGKKYVAQ